MPRKCAYFKCDNYKDDGHVSMFRFPVQHPDRLKQWIENSGNIKLKKLTTEQLMNRFICSEHFTRGKIHHGLQRSRLVGLPLPEPYDNVPAKKSTTSSILKDPLLKNFTNKRNESPPRLSPVNSKVSWSQLSEVNEDIVVNDKKTPQFQKKSATDSTMKNKGASGSNVQETADRKLGNCRCCLSYGLHNEMRKDHNETLLELNLFLQDDSRFPDRICQECVSCLEKFSEFRTKVIATQKKLAEAGRIKLEPEIEIEVRGTQQTTGADPLALTEINIKQENLDDDGTDSMVPAFNQIHDMEDGPISIPTFADDKPQEVTKSSKMNVVRVISATQSKGQKILIPIPQKGKLPVISPKGPIPKRLKMITKEMAAKLGLVGVKSSVIQPAGTQRTIIRLPPAVQRIINKQSPAPSTSSKNVRAKKLVAKTKPEEASSSKAMGLLAVVSIASETVEDSASGELEESVESRKRKSAENPTNSERPISKPKFKRKR